MAKARLNAKFWKTFGEMTGVFALTISFVANEYYVVKHFIPLCGLLILICMIQVYLLWDGD